MALNFRVLFQAMNLENRIIQRTKFPWSNAGAYLVTHTLDTADTTEIDMIINFCANSLLVCFLLRQIISCWLCNSTVCGYRGGGCGYTKTI